MKKLLISALILISSTISFGKFESQLGYTINEKDGTIFLHSNKNKNGNMAILEYKNNKISSDEFYSAVDYSMRNHEYQISDAGSNYVLVTTNEYPPILFINNGKYMIWISIPDDEHLRMASRYLKLNNIANSSTEFIISKVGFNLALYELNRVLND